MIQAGVTLFCGQTRTGKTTLALRELHEVPRRVVIFDPNADPIFDAWPSLDSPAAVRRWFQSRASWAAWWTVTIRGNRALYAWLMPSIPGWRGVTWLVDEPGLFNDATIAETAAEVATTGRHMGNHAGVELWVVSQRPMAVPITVRSQAQRIRSFYQDEPGDLAYLRQKAGRLFAERVLSLRGHQVAAWPEGSVYEARFGRGAGDRRVCAAGFQRLRLV